MTLVQGLDIAMMWSNTTDTSFKDHKYNIPQILQVKNEAILSDLGFVVFKKRQKDKF